MRVVADVLYITADSIENDTPTRLASTGSSLVVSKSKINSLEPFNSSTRRRRSLSFFISSYSDSRFFFGLWFFLSSVDPQVAQKFSPVLFHLGVPFYNNI